MALRIRRASAVCGERHQLSFIDASTGWASGGWRCDLGTLLTTHNGASSWRPLNLDIPDGYSDSRRNHFNLAFLSHDSGVPVLFFGGSDGGWLLGFYTTDDAGATCSLTGTLQRPGQVWSEIELSLACSAVDQTSWEVVVNGSRQFLSRDGG